MSTSNKLTYLNGTKQLLKDKINNLGGSIDDNTTFRNYAEELQDIYDNLPKTEYQEGTEVNLGKTTKGKLDYDNGVVGIGQIEQDSTKGYQLLNVNFASAKTNGIDFTNTNQVVKIKGTTTASANIEVGRATLPSGNYIITCSNMPYAWGTSRIEVSGTGFETLSFFSGNAQRQLTLSQETTITFLAIVSGTGTSVDYSTTIMLESGSTAHNWEQYSGGYSSPSPNWKQPIEYVRGWNLFNKDKTPENYYIDGSGGKVYVSNNDFINQEYSLRGAVTISFTNKSSNSAYVRLCEYNGSTFIRRTLVSASGTYPLSTNCDRVIFSVDNSESVYFTNLQIEQGSTQHPYTPYNTIEEVVSGKNILEGVELGDIDPQGGVAFGSDSSFRSINYIPYDTSKTYYVSVNDVQPTNQGLNLRFYNASKQYIGYSTLTGSGSNFVITKGNQVTTTDLVPKYFRFRQTMSAGPINNINDNVMIATISGATYEPYKTPKPYQFSLGDHKFYGIGNYKDELVYDVDEDKVYKNEKIKKVVYNGTENWNRSGGTTETVFVGSLSISGVVDHNGLSNYFTHSNYANANTFDVYNNGNNLALRFDINQISDVASLKTWLSTHNTEVYYQKATPTQTEITDTTLINQVKALYNAHSNNGTTIITSNGDLPMIIKCRGLKGE